MRTTTLPTRPKFDDVIRVPMTSTDKRKIFEVAAEENTTVSELIRRAVWAQLPQLAA